MSLGIRESNTTSCTEAKRSRKKLGSPCTWCARSDRRRERIRKRVLTKEAQTPVDRTPRTVDQEHSNEEAKYNDSSDRRKLGTIGQDVTVGGWSVLDCQSAAPGRDRAQRRSERVPCWHVALTSACGFGGGRHSRKSCRKTHGQTNQGGRGGPRFSLTCASSGFHKSCALCVSSSRVGALVVHQPGPGHLHEELCGTRTSTTSAPTDNQFWGWCLLKLEMTLQCGRQKGELTPV